MPPLTPSSPPLEDTSGDGSLSHSRVMSSCELFTMFKLLAAGRRKSSGGGAGESAAEATEDAAAPEDAEVATTDDESPAEPALRLRRPSSASTKVDREAVWVKDEMDRVGLMNQSAADKFAALSLDNATAEDDPASSPVIRARPALPRLSSQRPFTAEPVVESPSVLSTQTQDQDAPLELTDEQKLAAIQQEFGDISRTLARPGEDPEPERLLASSNAIMFKGVMMVGNTHLTTHRLLFHAPLPPDEAYVRKYATADGKDTAETMAFDQPVSHSDLLHSGPVTWHRTGPLVAAQRVWLELSAEMLSTYPSADDAGRTRPMRSILLTSIRKLHPSDPDHPSDFKITYEGQNRIRTAHFTVDTEPSAVQWRRDLESALYRVLRATWRAHISLHGDAHHLDTKTDTEWSMLRYCVPLDRVHVLDATDYHEFARLISMDVALDKGQRTLFDPESVARGDYHNASIAVPSEGPVATGGASGVDPNLVRVGGSELRRKFSLPKLGRKGSGKSDASGTSTPHTHSHDGETVHEHERHLSPLHPRGLCHTFSPRRASSRPPSRPHSPTHESPPTEPTPSDASLFTFNLVLLNDFAWYEKALITAVEAAHERQPVPGQKRHAVRLNIAGLDALATDEELEAAAKASRAASGSRQTSEDSEDGVHLADSDSDDVVGPEAEALAHEALDQSAKPKSKMPGAAVVKAARKAERTHLAAKVFGLREEEGIWIKRGYVIHNGVPVRGHIILTRRYVCFWRRMLMSQDIKYRFKTSDVKGVRGMSDLVQPACGIALQLHGHHDVHFDFWQRDARDEVVRRIQALIDARDTAADGRGPSVDDAVFSGVPNESPLALSPSTSAGLDPASTSSSSTGTSTPHAADILAPARSVLFERRYLPDGLIPQLPFLANKPWLSRTAALTPRTFAMLTIGSRGDVQPYIALGVRLMRDGHKAVIITHDEFKGWIEGYGIEHRAAGGDPTMLMKLSQEHSMLSPGFFKEALGTYRKWMDDLLMDSWTACQDADVLIESPSAMAGIHIAEALQIPYFRAFTMPWVRTSAYPHAFMVPAFDMGPQFNYSTYTLFENIIWTASAPQINRWRKAHLSLPATNMSNMSQAQIPFLYNFSEAVVPKPLDWPDAVNITGYWILEDSDKDWTPPEALETFMRTAKEQGRPLVYIGFGSIVVPKPNALTKNIIAAVEKAGVSAIIAKGWSSRSGEVTEEGKEIEFPASCYSLEKVPHGWLFPRIDAAMHHGGAGTTGASLRAGLPTIIKPFFGDQFFWALRVTKLGAGLKAASFRTDDIADALSRATGDRVMREKAARVGRAIRAESGVDAAVQAIQYNIVRAASDRRELSFAK